MPGGGGRPEPTHLVGQLEQHTGWGGRLASRAGVPCTPDGAPQAQGCLPVAVMPAQWLPAAAGHMQQNAQRAVPQPPRPAPARPAPHTPDVPVARPLPMTCSSGDAQTRCSEDAACERVASPVTLRSAPAAGVGVAAAAGASTQNHWQGDPEGAASSPRFAGPQPGRWVPARSPSATWLLLATSLRGASLPGAGPPRRSRPQLPGAARAGGTSVPSRTAACPVLTPLTRLWLP